METNEINLKPCPFCGSSASMRHCARFSHWVQCDKCGAGHPFAFETEEGAAAAWNSRAPEAETWTSDVDAPGNAAAMRAALEMFVMHASCLYHCDIHRFYPNATECDGVLGDKSECPMKQECDAVFAGRAALSAPARNCDVVLIENLAKRNIADIVWAAFRETHPKAYLDVPGLLQCINWLFDKAEGVSE